MGCHGPNSPCAAAAKAAKMTQGARPVRQEPQRTVVTPAARKQVEFRSRMKYAAKK
jgi:hypothetical protein